MQTEVVKFFKRGFVLSEQELRRIYQSCIDNCKKSGCDAPRHVTEIKMEDGAVLKSDDIEEILLLENSGSKKITRLKLEFDDGSSDPTWSIKVSFCDVSNESNTSTSVTLDVKSSSRDWAFITAAELEERLKKISIISWNNMLSKKWMSSVAMILMMVVMFGSMIFFTDIDSQPQAGQALQESYDSGAIKDPIEAIIFIENFRVENRPSIVNILMPMLYSTVGIFTVFLFFLFILPRMRYDYNFYWGDHISIFDKQKSRIKAITGFIVFGVFASLIAGWIQQLSVV
jgi:hypothetical protein